MASDKDIENLIKMLDSKTEAGISRINIQTSDQVVEGQTAEVHHHGRCDVGSCFAKGTVKNLDVDDTKGNE